jgi:hypothetical protein
MTMRTKTLALLAVLAGLAGTAVPAAADVLIRVDKASQRMTVSRDGQRLYDWPVSTGKQGHRTPEGDYTPFRAAEDHFSKEWDNAPMPHSLFFTARGHAIHGSGGVKTYPDSHGCVRLGFGNAKTLFALVRSEGLPRTRIVVAGVEPQSPVARRPSRTARPRLAPQYDYEEVYVEAPRPYDGN